MRDNTMNTKYQLTFEDFMALQKDSFKRIRLHQIGYTVILTLLISMVFMSAFAIMILILPKSIYLFSETLYFILAACLSILPVIFMRPLFKKFYDTIMIFLYRLLFKKENRWPRNITLHIHQSGIHLNSSNHQINKNMDVTWASIKDVGEDDNYLFLYYEDIEAIILPKNNPSLTETENKTLYKLVNQYLNRHVVNE
ncbi:YcxB family protein [Exiguobacterium aurantiacum]|uniref:YcxB family protein n=1 Tax=Exiguobacterium aurantiacum TaxID=33987 RepID=UPI00350E5122